MMIIYNAPKKQHELFVTFNPNDNNRKLHGEIRIVINYKGREHSIPDPCFTLIQ